jgi:GntR family transcriptional regulator/MocR family aminotransferase
VDFDRAAGQVDAENFPRAAWARCAEQALREVLEEGGGYPPVGGDERLKRAVCLWLRRNRGFEADPELVSITSGVGAACATLARILRGKRRAADTAAVEDPGLPALRGILSAAGWRIRPVPVDREGVRAPRDPAALLLAAPSHQFPTGAILSAGRRAAILDWAAGCGAYVIEDDYDSDFRYEGAPIPPMASLDPDRVAYIGTFSKLLFPGIRLGFAVLPPPLHRDFLNAGRDAGIRPPAHSQRTLARFMEEGLMDKHIVAMRKAYRAKRGGLIAALREEFGESVPIGGAAAGLFLTAGLDPLRTRGGSWAARGVKARRAGDYALASVEDPDRFILGYGGLSKERIREGITRLRAALVSPAVEGSIRVFEEGAY